MSVVTITDADAVNEVVQERLVHAGLVNDTAIAARTACGSAPGTAL